MVWNFLLVSAGLFSILEEYRSWIFRVEMLSLLFRNGSVWSLYSHGTEQKCGSSRKLCFPGSKGLAWLGTARRVCWVSSWQREWCGSFPLCLCWLGRLFWNISRRSFLILNSPQTSPSHIKQLSFILAQAFFVRFAHLKSRLLERPNNPFWKKQHEWSRLWFQTRAAVKF